MAILWRVFIKVVKKLRIIARIYALSLPIFSIKKEITKLSQGLIYKKRPGDMIQSLMDFGSLICKPQNPICEECFIKKKCKSFEKKLTNIIPAYYHNITT